MGLGLSNLACFGFGARLVLVGWGGVDRIVVTPACLNFLRGPAVHGSVFCIITFLLLKKGGSVVTDLYSKVADPSFYINLVRIPQMHHDPRAGTNSHTREDQYLLYRSTNIRRL